MACLTALCLVSCCGKQVEPCLRQQRCGIQSVWDAVKMKTLIIGYLLKCYFNSDVDMCHGFNRSEVETQPLKGFCFSSVCFVFCCFSDEAVVCTPFTDVFILLNVVVTTINNLFVKLLSTNICFYFLFAVFS